MATECEIKPYILKLTDDKAVQEKLNDEHNKIFDRLKKSKNFQKEYYGKIWEKRFPRYTGEDISKGRQFVKEINDEYGTEVVGFVKSHDNNRYLFVNVRNLLPRFTSGEQLKMLQTTPVSKKNPEVLKQQAYTLFNDYININGIKLEFLDRVLDEFGNDVVAVYDAFNKVIKINQNMADETTLPEELAHHLTLALGLDHTLVKRALTLINRLDYKAILGSEYVELYKGNEQLLKLELLGKLISRYTANNKLPSELYGENGTKLWETIKSLVKAFIKLFKPNSNIMSSLDDIVKELSDMLNKGTNVGSLKFNTKMYQLDTNPLFATKFLEERDDLGSEKRFSVRPTLYKTGIYKIGKNYFRIILVNDKKQLASEFKNINLIKNKSLKDESIKFDHIKAFYNNDEPMYVYQIQKVDDSFKNEALNVTKVDLTRNIRPQYVYYKERLNKLKKRQKLGDTLTPKELEEIKRIESVLTELTTNGNVQLLINLANDTLDTIDDYINTLNDKIANGETVNLHDITSMFTILKRLSSLEGVKDRVSQLSNRLTKYINQFGVQKMSKLTGLSEQEVDEQLNKLDKDMGRLEKWFGTLADVKNIIGKSIGLLIKEAQALIERENKQSYNNIKSHVDKLKEWGSNNGMSLEEVYNIFIQEDAGTLKLTKPYTTEFYETIRKSFEDPNGIKIRNAIAMHSDNGWVPRDLNKYSNKNYDLIQKNPALKEFYTFFKGVTKSINDKLPLDYYDEFFIPNVVSKTLLDIFKSDDSIAAKLKEGVSNLLDADVDNISFFIDDEEVDQDASRFDKSLKKDTIPLKYIKKIKPENKSKDLGAVLLQFSYFANSYNEMTKVLPQARLMQDMIKQRDMVNAYNDKETIPGEDTNLNQIVEGFIQQQVLGNKKDKDEKYAPVADFAIKYTSLLRIGLNIQNALTNVFIGNIGNVIEAIGGRYFTLKQYINAVGIFSKENIDSDSKTNKLVELFNPLQELDDYENLTKMKVGTNEYKDWVKSLMYSFQRLGEKQMQVSTMIAILHNIKLETKSGEKITMWDAFNEDGTWNKELMGYDLTEDKINQITNKVHRVNQMIHGRYSSKDHSILMQHALFRLAFQFKKWIPAAIEARWGGERYDARLGETIKGRYRSFFTTEGWKALGALLTFHAQEGIEKGTLSELEVYNMRKNLTEATIILATILAGIGFKDDDKRKDPLYKFSMDQLNRLSQDLLYFYNPDEHIKMLDITVPATKTAQDLLKVFKNIPAIVTDEKYKTGKRKGENKFAASIKDVTPGYKPFQDIVRMFNDAPYQVYNR